MSACAPVAHGLLRNVRQDCRDATRGPDEHCHVVGLDLVEVNPTLDVGTEITSYLAAHTVLEFLGNICRQTRWERHREARALARKRTGPAEP